MCIRDSFKYDAYTVLDTVIMGNKRLYEIMKEKDAIYAKADFTDEDGIRASELEGEFAEMNGWEAESDADVYKRQVMTPHQRLPIARELIIDKKRNNPKYKRI